MADQTTTVFADTEKDTVIDFGEICRFCLSKTKSDVYISQKCLRKESKEFDEESIYNFMTKISFIKMTSLDNFPAKVCENCFKLIQLCHNFSQICQKSENLLNTYYQNSLKQTEVKNKSPLKDPFCEELLDFGNDNQQKPTNNFSIDIEEINKIKKHCSGQNLTDSFAVLETYKQKLTLLSERVKAAQSKLTSDSSGKKLNLSSQHICSHCSLKFTNSKALNFHYIATHTQKRFRTSLKLQCKNCLKSFSCEEKLKRHYVTHKMPESSDDYLNTSMKQLTEVDERILFCFHCVPWREFQTQDELTEHLENFHMNEQSKVVSKYYSCVHCQHSTFPTRLSLNQHLSLVHKLSEDEITWNDWTDRQDTKSLEHENLPECEKQSQNFTDFSAFLDVLDSVVDSLNVIQGETGYKVLCKNCSPQLEFTSANDFVNHIQNHHGEQNWTKDKAKEGPWNCSECSATYARKQSLHYHLKEKHKHANVGGMKCPDCHERFTTNRQLIQHGISVHQKYFAFFHNVYRKILQSGNEEEEQNKVKNFECDMCKKKYIYKTSLKKHILAAHLGNSFIDSVVCSFCGKTLSNKLNLKSHIEFVHEALFVSCPVCKKRINFRTIGKHYKTHKNSDVIHSKNSFLCTLCGKVLKSKRSFEDHQKLHKNIRDELCDVCGSGFTTKKCLRLHKKTHERVQRKVFGCDQCDKVFSGRHTLNRHLLTHSGKKNFVCEICSKCFYTLQELNRHVRYHKKEYRFDCQLCDMRFLDKSRFRHHMMRHRNVRPHKCQFCDKMFIVRAKMNLHMATKHNFEVQNTKGTWKDPKTYVPLDDLL